MSLLQNKPQFKFYATLLDSFQGYLDSSKTYQKFWGFSQDPKMTEEEYEEKAFNELIDKINRVPFESEAADKGTAFNEVIDCLIEGRKSDNMDISSDKVKNAIHVNFKDWNFKFNLSLCKEIAGMLEGALTQQRVEAIMPTKYGNVLLYGYLDQLLPFIIVDLKTTKSYNAFKYRYNWQHKVYPYCLNQNGVEINRFDYLVTNFIAVFRETYIYNPELDYIRLQDHCEQLIGFLNKYRHLITDQKVFALDELTMA